MTEAEMLRLNDWWFAKQNKYEIS